MSRLSLDNVGWGEFYLSDIFDFIERGRRLKISDREEGLVPFVTAGESLNGVSSFVNNEKHKIYENGITIDMFGNAFFQKGIFKCDDNITVLKNQKFNDEIYLFLTSRLNILKQKYSYGKQLRPNRLCRDKLVLPIDSNGNPNWQFMEDYVKQEMQAQSQCVVSYYENKLLKLGGGVLDLEVEWKEFKVKDLFKVKPVKGKSITHYKEGEIPYITTSSVDNGLNNFIDTEDNISLKKCISIDPIGGKSFFHEYDFVGRGGAGSAINLLYNNALDEYSGLFICKMLESSSFSKASYGVQLNGDRLKNLKLLLPTDKNGNPNWQYMSNFIKKLEKENIEKTLEHIYIYIYMIAKKLKKQYSFENVVWKEYFIEDICDIKSGVRLAKAEQKKGKIPFVGAVDNNNGVTEFIENINNSFDKNILSVNYNGSVVETFYHPYESIFSDDVKRVSFTDKSQNNEYALLFLKQMIIQQKSKYQYGYKFNGKRMARQKIILPSKNNSTPDYDFMKKYMMIQEILKIKEILEFY